MSNEELSIQNIYLKSLSFQSNNTPNIFYQGLTLKPSLELSFSINKLEESLFEIVMEIIITTTAETPDNGEIVVYKIIASKAGLFRVSGYSPEQLDEVLNVNCPSILFPFLRLEIDNIVHYSGFQSFNIQPVSFHNIYENKKNTNNLEVAKDS